MCTGYMGKSEWSKVLAENFIFRHFYEILLLLLLKFLPHTCMQLAITSAFVYVEGVVVAMGKCVPKACLIEDFPRDYEMYNITTNNMFLCGCNDDDDDDNDDYEYVTPAAINQS